MSPTATQDATVNEKEAGEVAQVSGDASLEARIARYEAEREPCIAQRRAEVDASYSEAEHYCNVIVLARKYYAADPQGMIELCVRENQVSGYTKERGFASGLTRAELDEAHRFGLFRHVTMDEAGNEHLDETALQDWHDLCQEVIETNLE